MKIGFLLFITMWLIAALGCGTTRKQAATDQLLLTDAVDRSVSHIDFSPLSDEKVYLDTSYMPLKSSENNNYIVSSLRQQMALAGCLLQSEREAADYIVEVRVGALAIDGHDVNYGIPANHALTAAANVVSNSAVLPAIPEISIVKKAHDSAVAKIAVFAYHRETKDPVWQSGILTSRSTAQHKWILGAGPFETGEIYKDGTRFAGTRLKGPKNSLATFETDLQEQAYRSAAVFDDRIQGKLSKRSDDNAEEEESLVAKRLANRSSESPNSAGHDSSSGNNNSVENSSPGNLHPEFDSKNTPSPESNGDSSNDTSTVLPPDSSTSTNAAQRDQSGE